MASDYETKVFFSLTAHFGQKETYYSSNFGVGATYKFSPHLQTGVNLGFRVYNGGLGSIPGSDKLNLDFVGTGAFTTGIGKGNPMDLNPLTIDHGTGMQDRYKKSITIGTDNIFNNFGRNQQVGFLQTRFNDFTFQNYNDFDKFGRLSDGHDRWYTGGGNVTMGSNSSNYQVILSSDVFTSDTNNAAFTRPDYVDYDLLEKNNPLPGNFRDRFTYTPNIAGELDQKYLNEHRGGRSWLKERDSFSLNQGRTSVLIRTPDGTTFGLSHLGSFDMWSQEIIHRMINFHLIPSTSQDRFEFSYKKGF